MKKGMAIFLLFTVVLLISVPFVSADDDHDERYNRGNGEEREEDEAAEEIGEALGWGAVGLAVGAGLLFPLKRSYPFLVQWLPKKREWKKRLSSLFKLLSKWHLLAGLLALTLMIIHGLFMFYAEGELSGRDWLGVFSASLIALGLIPGLVLLKNKKSRFIRKVHIAVVSVAGTLAIVHIALS